MHNIEMELQGIRAELARLRETVAKPLPTVLRQQRAAKELDVSLSKLKQLIRSHQILTVVVGKTKMVPLSEIRRLSAPVVTTRKGRALAARAVKEMTAQVSGSATREALRRAR